MKKSLIFALSGMFLLSTAMISCSQSPASPRKQASGHINEVKVAIDYGAPSVKDRKIWGGLEKYGKVWRAGANECTSIAFDKAVNINGEAIEAGTYAFFIIPNEEGDWVAIFNSESEQWGAYDYNEEKDVLRLNVTPQWSDQVQEQLLYKIEDGSILFAWEKASLKLDVSSE